MTEPFAAPTRQDQEGQHGMVFLDPGVVTVLEPASDRRGPGRLVAVPGAAESLALLGDPARIAVIGDAPLIDVPELATLHARAAIPDDFPPGSWFITSDPTWCEGERPSGLRSILVGPKRPPARRPVLRCDVDARDLNAAVLEILVRETMA
jgi:hypothetical protein